MACAGFVNDLARRVRLDSSAGVGLVETIVALGIATVVFTAMAYAGITALTSTQSARINQQAIDLATQRIEDARALGYGALGHSSADLAGDPLVASCAGQPCLDPGIGTQENLVVIDGAALTPHRTQVSGQPTNQVTFDVATYVTRPADASAADFKRVTTIVTWNYRGNPGTRSMSTLVSQATRGLPLPEFQLTPLGETTQSRNPGNDAAFGFTLRNQGAADQFNLAATGTGWAFYQDNGDQIFVDSEDNVPLGDSSSDGLPDTGRLDPDSEITFWAVKTVSLAAEPGSYEFTITANSVSQEAAVGASQGVIVTLVVVDGVISASPTPSPSATESPTVSPTPTPTPTGEAVIVTCPAPSTVPTPAGANQYSVKAYTLHNSGNVSWPTLPLPATDPIPGTAAIGPLFLDQDPERIPEGRALPVYSSNLTPANTAGRILPTGGSFAAGTDNVLDFRTSVKKKKYTNTVVLRIWVAEVSGPPTNPISLTMQPYEYDTVSGATNTLSSPVTTAYSSLSCDGWQEIAFQAPVSTNMGNNEVIGVRLWNSGPVRVRVGYDHEELPSSFTVVER